MSQQGQMKTVIQINVRHMVRQIPNECCIAFIICFSLRVGHMTKLYGYDRMTMV